MEPPEPVHPFDEFPYVVVWILPNNEIHCRPISSFQEAKMYVTHRMPNPGVAWKIYGPEGVMWE